MESVVLSRQPMYGPYSVGESNDACRSSVEDILSEEQSYSPPTVSCAQGENGQAPMSQAQCSAKKEVAPQRPTPTGPGVPTGQNGRVLLRPGKICLDKVKPLETQVAGHGTGAKISHRGMLIHEDGYVFKPAQAPPKGTREIQFYERISSSNHPVDKMLYSLVPKFFGTETISRDGISSSQYLILEDLTKGMVSPCVMDVKIGAKTYGPDATRAKMQQEDAKYLGTKKPLGYSVLGIINRSGKNGALKRFDKTFGMELETSSVSKIIQVFFNTDVEEPKIVKQLIAQFTAELGRIKTFFESQTRYHIYASSLLLVYDHSIFGSRENVTSVDNNSDTPVGGCQSAPNGVKMPRNAQNGVVVPRESQNGDRVSHIVENTTQNGTQMSHSAAKLSHRDEDSARPHHEHVRLKIIDFAHVFPGQETRDENFLFGLNNLHQLFSSFT
eukprot:TRINITY_DN5829_c0_g1_i2.p1 TRINITY_DN5829_c0_g1~~TRINITY_DN5829_c0_g1_i2.p1  ORF type:complete len:442 (-),score=72.14 TRINITY_DN5829_c0_g1_i2:359-1684(-)